MHGSLYLENFTFHIHLLDTNSPFNTWVKDSSHLYLHTGGI